MAEQPDAFDEIFKHINEKVVDTANLFLRSAILINGGAAVALLGFVASISSGPQSNPEALAGIADAIAMYAFAAAVGVVGIAFAYLTNYAALATHRRQGQTDERRLAIVKRTLHVVAALVAIFTIVLFVWGTVTVKTVITNSLSF